MAEPTPSTTAKTADPKVEEPKVATPEGSVWFHTGTGDFNVDVGSAAWERFVADGLAPSAPPPHPDAA